MSNGITELLNQEQGQKKRINNLCIAEQNMLLNFRLYLYSMVVKISIQNTIIISLL